MHHDLKPKNFLLTNKDDDLSLKAIDFGLSVFFKPGKELGILQFLLQSESFTVDHVLKEVTQKPTISI